MSRFARGLFVAVMAGVFLASGPAAAQDRIVQNDSLGEQQEGRIGSAELVAGEGYYVTLDIPQAISLPVELLGVRVLMVDSDDPSLRYCGRFHVEVFEESTARFEPPASCPLVNAKDPGAVIYSMSQQFGPGGIAFEVEGNARNLQDLRFSQINNNPQINATINPVVVDTRRIRIGIKAVDRQCQTAGDEFPIIVSDMDGTQGDNFVYGEPSICAGSGSEYYHWREFGQFLTTTTPSDFVIRAVFEGTGGGGDTVVVDAGSDGGTSSDVGDSGGGDVADEDVTDDTGVEDTAAEDTGGEQDDAGGEDDASSATFAVESVSPSKLASTASTDVVIVGQGFEAGAQVRLDAEAVGVIEVQSGLIEATVPEGFAVGTYDLIVSNPGGETAMLQDGIEIYDPDAEGTADAGDGNASNDGGAAEGGCGCASNGQGRVPVGGLALLVIGLLAARARRIL